MESAEAPDLELGHVPVFTAKSLVFMIKNHTPLPAEYVLRMEKYGEPLGVQATCVGEALLHGTLHVDSDDLMRTSTIGKLRTRQARPAPPRENWASSPSPPPGPQCATSACQSASAGAHWRAPPRLPLPPARAYFVTPQFTQANAAHDASSTATLKAGSQGGSQAASKSQRGGSRSINDGASFRTGATTAGRGRVTLSDDIEKTQRLVSTNGPSFAPLPPISLIRPDFSVLARACLWCLGARMCRVNHPLVREKHTEFMLNTAHCVSILPQAGWHHVDSHHHY